MNSSFRQTLTWIASLMTGGHIALAFGLLALSRQQILASPPVENDGVFLLIFIGAGVLAVIGFILAVSVFKPALNSVMLGAGIGLGSGMFIALGMMLISGLAPFLLIAPAIGYTVGCIIGALIGWCDPTYVVFTPRGLLRYVLTFYIACLCYLPTIIDEGVEESVEQSAGYGGEQLYELALLGVSIALIWLLVRVFKRVIPT